MKIRFGYFFMTCIIMSFVLISGCNKADDEQLPNYPDELWSESYGEYSSYGQDIIETNDGGFAITGYARFAEASTFGVILVKIDSDGNEEWKKVYDHGTHERGYCIQQTSDGGFIIVGKKFSNDTEQHGFLLLKTDSAGNVEWTQVFTGQANSEGFFVEQTNDGGYIITGRMIFDETGSDVALIKTDAYGNTEWEKYFDNGSNEDGYCVRHTSDEGYIVVGSSRESEREYDDAWIIKTDATGNMQWDKIWGGSLPDLAYGVVEPSAGEYIVTGCAYPSVIYSNIMLIKYDSDGNEIWNLSHGEIGRGTGFSIEMTNDGNLLVGGYDQYGYQSTGEHSGMMAKVGTNGNVYWYRTFATETESLGKYAIQVSDGRYLMTGSIFKENAEFDSWLVWLVCVDSD